MARIGYRYEPQRQNQPIDLRYRTGPTSATTYLARLQIAPQCTEILGDPYLGTDQSEGYDGSSPPEFPLIDLLLTNCATIEANLKASPHQPALMLTMPGVVLGMLIIGINAGWIAEKITASEHDIHTICWSGSPVRLSEARWPIL